MHSKQPASATTGTVGKCWRKAARITPEELHQVGMWLDMYPNFHVDIDARISELGRQPYTCRKFLIKYQDRVMFGTDTPPKAEAYRIYYRFLETWDEYFDPAGSHQLQGRWMIYGIGLPDEVLEKIYHINADKIFAQFKARADLSRAHRPRMTKERDVVLNI